MNYKALKHLKEETVSPFIGVGTCERELKPFYFILLELNSRVISQ